MRTIWRIYYVKVDLSNYATKSDFENATEIDTSKLAAKSDLVNLKTEVDKSGINKLKSVPTNLRNLKSKVDILDIEKLETTPVDLSRQSNVVKNDVEIKNNEDKIPDITNLATKTPLDAKIAGIKAGISSINNLATTSTITTV